jgi:hypothetical protein
MHRMNPPTSPPQTSRPFPLPAPGRGMLDGQGRPWLEDYPYGRDGLDIFAELEAYFGQYLRLYYASDADVAGDVELQAWWAEVKVWRGGGGIGARLRLAACRWRLIDWLPASHHRSSPRASEPLARHCACCNVVPRWPYGCGGTPGAPEPCACPLCPPPCWLAGRRLKATPTLRWWSRTRRRCGALRGPSPPWMS